VKTLGMAWFRPKTLDMGVLSSRWIVFSSSVQNERDERGPRPEFSHSFSAYPTAVAPTHGLAADNPAVLAMQGALERFSAIAAGQ
jgi:hypothetical protein